MNKYKNNKVEIDGIVFDSQKEALRYRDLKLMERAGLIVDLQLQVPFVLYHKNQYGRDVKYVADFVYQEKGQMIVEDVKGYKTDVYKLKKRMMAEELGIVIREI